MRLNDVPQWLPGEEEAKRGPIYEFTEFDSASFEAEQDLQATRTKTREKKESFDDVTGQISHPPREVVRYREDFFGSSDTLVLCVAADIRVTTTPI